MDTSTPTVNQVIRITAESQGGPIIMEARIRYRFLTPGLSLGLDVPHGKQTTIPNKLELEDDGSWTIVEPRICPIVGRTVSLEILA